MTALDIDLDFFLSDVCELAELGARPTGAIPWNENDIRMFFEERCMLSRENKIRGSIFETHDYALDFWRDMEKPLDVIHIDAHSDLAIGRPGPAYMIDTIAALPVDVRNDLEKYRDLNKLDEGNYLMFAVAMRWVRTLVNVRNPRSRPDIPQRALDENGNIHIVPSVAKLIPALDRHEPTIPFTVYDDWRYFRIDAPADAASLALSPRYAPVEADFIADIFREYIEVV